MIARTKHSRQRDAILDFLNGNESHPTAQEIYTGVQLEIPHVSLGTIYRNLNQMAEAGEIRKISCADGPDRFDFRTFEHGHFICRCCGRLFDVPDGVIRMDPEAGLPGAVETFDFTLYGVCTACQGV